MNQICSANAVQAGGSPMQVAAPIEHALHGLTCNSLSLSDTLSELESRLMPVLSPAVESSDQDKRCAPKDPRAPDSSIANLVNSESMRLEGFNHRLLAILSRLEL